MRETVLLINFQDEKQLRDLKMILFTLKIRMKKVEKKEYLQQIGFLAGISNQRLDQILSMMRKNGVKRVDYKAILTETNKTWTVPRLYEEISKEHAQMHRQS